MKETVSEIIKDMSKQDVYSIVMSFLFDLKNDPKYTLLSELCYIMDEKSFTNFIECFEGMTIKVPTKKELSELIQVLRLFQLYEVEGRPWKDAVIEVGLDSSSGKMAKNNVNRLKRTFEKYNVGNRGF